MCYILEERGLKVYLFLVTLDYVSLHK